MDHVILKLGLVFVLVAGLARTVKHAVNLITIFQHANIALQTQHVLHVVLVILLVIVLVLQTMLVWTAPSA